MALWIIIPFVLMKSLASFCHMDSLSFDTSPSASFVASSEGYSITGRCSVSIASLVSESWMYSSLAYSDIALVVFIYRLAWPWPILYTYSERLVQFPENLTVDTSHLQDAPPLPLLFFGVSPTLTSSFSNFMLAIIMTCYIRFLIFVETWTISLPPADSTVTRRVMWLILIIFLVHTVNCPLLVMRTLLFWVRTLPLQSLRSVSTANKVL